MTLSAEVTRHHSAWIQAADSRPRVIRYAVDGDQLVCFGDQLPSEATNGKQVSVTIHEIAGGPALAQLHGTVHDVAVGDIDPNAVLDLLEHVSLGRTAGEVATSIERHRHRRLVALEI